MVPAIRAEAAKRNIPLNSDHVRMVWLQFVFAPGQEHWQCFCSSGEPYPFDEPEPGSP